MKEAIVGVKKEKGYLYYVDKEGDVGRSKMARGGTKGQKGPQEKVAIVGVKKDKHRLYFIDKEGDIGSKPMNRPTKELPRL
jgi:hypothetical protein